MFHCFFVCYCLLLRLQHLKTNCCCQFLMCAFRQDFLHAAQLENLNPFQVFSEDSCFLNSYMKSPNWRGLLVSTQEVFFVSVCDTAASLVLQKVVVLRLGLYYSDRALVWHVGGPGFNPQCPQKRKRKVAIPEFHLVPVYDNCKSDTGPSHIDDLCS